jgi:hypothetical protein
VRPGTCVIQRRKLRRSAVRRHRSSQPGEHACSGSVAWRHGESGYSGGHGIAQLAALRRGTLMKALFIGGVAAATAERAMSWLGGDCWK